VSDDSPAPTVYFDNNFWLRFISIPSTILSYEVKNYTMSQKDLLRRTSEGDLVVLYETDGMRSAVIAANLDESQAVKM